MATVAKTYVRARFANRKLAVYALVNAPAIPPPSSLALGLMK